MTYFRVNLAIYQSPLSRSIIKITDARQVVVQLGLFKFDLLPQNLAGLRALVDHLAEIATQ